MSANLLFDQNISWRILALIKGEFPHASHINQKGLSAASDAQVWEFARAKNFCIVSKDADFRQLSFLYGAPPKAIWLRLGNCKVGNLADCINRNALKIKGFIADSENAFLVLD